MLIAVSQLRHYTLHAQDGDLGQLDEVYFDDQHWTVRYLVVELGRWLMGRRVLLAPAVAGPPDPQAQRLPIQLTRARIEQSPATDFDQPIDERHQADLAAHYNWPVYWGQGFGTAAPFLFLPMPLSAGLGPAADPLGGVGPAPSPAAPATLEGAHAGPPDAPPANTHLRSSRALTRYGLHTRDGEEFGGVADLVLEHPGWRVRHLVADTRKWLPGREVMIEPAAIERVDWNEAHVRLALTRAEVEAAPAWPPQA